MRVVAEADVLEHLRARGGSVYIWPKTAGCCRGRTCTLEASTEPAERKAFERIYEEHGVRVYATPGLAEPERIELELGRRDRILAFWNGQAWIG